MKIKASNTGFRLAVIGIAIILLPQPEMAAAADTEDNQVTPPELPSALYILPWKTQPPAAALNPPWIKRPRNPMKLIIANEFKRKLHYRALLSILKQNLKDIQTQP